jgi:hypothetical protein
MPYQAQTLYCPGEPVPESCQYELVASDGTRKFPASLFLEQGDQFPPTRTADSYYRKAG